MRPLIITKLPVASADAIKTNLQTQITALEPFKVNLSDGEKISLECSDRTTRVY
jgi:hypothetical protein